MNSCISELVSQVPCRPSVASLGKFSDSEILQEGLVCTSTRLSV